MAKFQDPTANLQEVQGTEDVKWYHTNTTSETQMM